MPNSAQEQTQRRALLRELLLQGSARTQKMLVNELATQGMQATQSSVSRDLRELGAVKTRHGYELPEHDGHVDEIAAVAEFLRDITPAGANLTVIRTAIGAAQRVALALDRSEWPEIIGNIGGDDTVFVATGSVASQKILISKIERACA
jgi:transcriptional regulator of arginine metabolism